MITRLKASLPNHNIVSENSPDLYIVDYTHIHNGNVVLLSTKPHESSVYLENDNQVPVYFDGFAKNALQISVGLYSKQCECIVFPQACLDSDWILFVETKYTDCLENACRASNGYPSCMIAQIIDTVTFFRNKGIIDPEKRVNALVSFPTLIDDFNAWFFSGTMSIEDIIINHKIKIRAKNSAKIVSSKTIKI